MQDPIQKVAKWSDIDLNLKIHDSNVHVLVLDREASLCVGSQDISQSTVMVDSKSQNATKLITALHLKPQNLSLA